MTVSQRGFETATELVAQLQGGKVSALELTDETIRRIEKYDAQINAICVRDFERARAAARDADAARKAGSTTPLLGIPITVKESFNVAGLPTTWGIPEQRNFMATEDALPIQRVKQAGTIIVGKTNVPLALSDWQSYNDIYGTTNNPYKLATTPGGSSGGSSAALAAGFGALSLGSDIGGSLRAPAHYCGVYAHKPTFALCPLRGHVCPPLPPLPFERDLSVIGPMARSAADLALLLDVMAGPDELDAGVGLKLALPPPRHADLKDYRILVLDNHPLIGTAASVAGAINTLAEQLSREGATVVRQSPLLPDLTTSTRLYMKILMSFLGASYPPDVYAAIQTLAAGLSPDDLSLAAERARGVVMSHRDWLITDGGRTRLRAQWRDFFKQFDAVICPIMPTPAFPQDQLPDQEQRKLDIDGKAYPYTDQLAWPGIATLPGLPATALPIAMSGDGLPIGVQIVGPWLEDRTPIKLAELIERAFGGFTPPPKFAS